MKKVLVTGAAGFIGYHVSESLLKDGMEVVGLDNVNDYYSTELKESRLAHLGQRNHFKFYKSSLEDRERLDEMFRIEGIEAVIHLAAQAGVRYSLINPYSYIESNVSGFLNVLEACRKYQTKHLVYASSSSVYGANTELPYSVNQSVDHPISLYAATKKTNELMAHTYSHLYRIPTTGLRFFTVYGPWGRPDMAYFMFTDAIMNDKPIKVYNHGHMRRDFTYIDDIVEGVKRVLKKVPSANETSGTTAPYKLYNIGNNQPVELSYFISTLEELIGKKAQKVNMPIQPGDVLETFADIDDLIDNVGFKPKTSIEDGLKRFVEWYQGYYKPATLNR